MKTIWKKEAGTKWAIMRQGSAAEAGSPERLWSLQNQQDSQSLQKHLGRPVPCEQGAADVKATASAADPYENSCGWILYCPLVLWVLWVLRADRWIGRIWSVTHSAYDASFAKFVSLVQRMMHRLLNLFRFLHGATSDALRIREFYVTCFTGWLNSFFCNSVPASLGGFGTFGSSLGTATAK